LVNNVTDFLESISKSYPPAIYANFHKLEE
jgi:hypothetical protein